MLTIKAYFLDNDNQSKLLQINGWFTKSAGEEETILQVIKGNFNTTVSLKHFGFCKEIKKWMIQLVLIRNSSHWDAVTSGVETKNPKVKI